jgi:hypothetical protein
MVRQEICGCRSSVMINRGEVQCRSAVLLSSETPLFFQILHHHLDDGIDSLRRRVGIEGVADDCQTSSPSGCGGGVGFVSVRTVLSHSPGNRREAAGARRNQGSQPTRAGMPAHSVRFLD